MNILTQVTQNYLEIFGSTVNQFLHWGQWLFYTLLVIQIVWMTLWYAFDHHSFSESMASFIKRFFTISLFYTLMINPSWVAEIVKTAVFMGHTLTNTALDPASLIEQGIGISNKIIFVYGKSNLLDANLGIIFISAIYGIIIYSFMSIAIDMSLTLITLTALISMSTFFLSFSSLATTSGIARQTLDIILANCFKLLGLYLVVAAGCNTLQPLVNHIPETMTKLDPYIWIVAITILFRQLAKILPQELVKIISGITSSTTREDFQSFNSTQAIATSAIKSLSDRSHDTSVLAVTSSMNEPFSPSRPQHVESNDTELSLSKQFKQLSSKLRNNNS